MEVQEKQPFLESLGQEVGNEKKIFWLVNSF
jgi:hypothetical protein